MLARFVECFGFQLCFPTSYTQIEPLECAETSLIAPEVTSNQQDPIFTVYENDVEVNGEFEKKMFLRALVLAIPYGVEKIDSFIPGANYFIRSPESRSEYKIVFHEPVHVVNPSEIEKPLTQSILAQLDKRAYSNCEIHQFITKSLGNVCLTSPIAFYPRKSQKLRQADTDEPRHRHCVAAEIIARGGASFIFRGKTVIPNRETGLPFFKEDKPGKGRIIKEEICNMNPNQEDRTPEYNLKHESMILQQLEYQHSKEVSEIPMGDEYRSHLLNVSRLFEGQELEAYIKSRGNEFTCGNWELEIAISIARNLVLIQDANVIHRDLKPRNMMLNHTTVKVVDFGLSRLSSETSNKPNRGTLKYMAPESVMVIANDEKSDIFSAGIIFIRLFGGKAKRFTAEQSQRAKNDGYNFLTNEFKTICDNEISLDGVCQRTSYTEEGNEKLRGIIKKMIIVNNPDDRIKAKNLLEELIAIKDLEASSRMNLSR